ncbi:DUF4442 domain-containing protein [Thalassotalea profundi]|nr:DUF4442 domain-containing protein [Thalassotalea profundi]
MKLLLNIWPPFLFCGIRIVYLSADFREAKVELRMRPWNKNAFGAHFGGSLYAMTDPFYVLMLMPQLGDQYYVWDKSADIDYIKPGKGVVYAEFHINEAMVDDIINNTASGEKYLPEYSVVVKDKQGDVVAQLNRTLYVRKKKRHR